jgi:hypothetical protein
MGSFGQGGLTGGSGWSPLFSGHFAAYDLNPLNIGTVRTPQEEQIQSMFIAQYGIPQPTPQVQQMINSFIESSNINQAAGKHPIDEIILQEREEQETKLNHTMQNYNFRINLLDKEHKIVSVSIICVIDYLNRTISTNPSNLITLVPSATLSELIIYNSKNIVSLDPIPLKGAKTITYILPEDWVKQIEEGTLKKYFFIGNLEQLKEDILKINRRLIFDKDI